MDPIWKHVALFLQQPDHYPLVCLGSGVLLLTIGYRVMRVPTLRRHDGRKGFEAAMNFSVKQEPGCLFGDVAMRFKRSSVGELVAAFL